MGDAMTVSGSDGVGIGVWWSHWFVWWWSWWSWSWWCSVVVGGVVG